MLNIEFDFLLLYYRFANAYIKRLKICFTSGESLDINWYLMNFLFTDKFCYSYASKVIPFCVNARSFLVHVTIT